MKSKTFIGMALMLVFFMCLVAIVFSFYFWLHRPFDSRNVQVHFAVGQSIGIEVNDSALSFGRVLPSSVSQKNIFLDNPYPFSVSVQVYVSDSISPYLFTPRGSLTLDPLTKQEVPFILAAPTNFGDYQGSVLFVFRRA